jgi:hypothetical protein
MRVGCGRGVIVDDRDGAMTPPVVPTGCGARPTVTRASPTVDADVGGGGAGSAADAESCGLTGTLPSLTC